MNRLRIAFFLLGCLFVFSALGQDNGSSGTPSGGGGQQATGGGGQEATGGAAGAGQAVSAPAAPVVMPGAYGSSPVSLTPGEGRFAKPPYDFSLTLQQGYDTNVFTTATNMVSSLVNNANFNFQMQGATPRTIFTFDATAGISYYWHRPGVKPEDYNGNISLLFFHRISPRMNISTTLSLAYLSQPNFSALNATINQQGGAYILGTGRINLSYQWAAKLQTNTSYSLNTTLYQEKTAQSGNIAENTLGNEFRFLLNPRTSIVAEARYTATGYPNAPTGDSATIYGLLGADYTFTSRLSATLRGGLQYRSYSNTAATRLLTRDELVLRGGLFEFNANSNSTSQTSPYVETTLSYIYGHQSTFQWTNRFGLDSSNISSQKVTSFRTGVNFNHVLTAKMILTLGLNYNVSSTATSPRTLQTLTGLNPYDYYSLSEMTVPTTTQNQINSVLGLQYLVTPKFSLNASYTFTDVISATQAASYTRSQFFLGGTYTF